MPADSSTRAKNTDLALEPHSFMLSDLVSDLSGYTPDEKRSYVRHVGEIIKSNAGYSDTLRSDATLLPTAHWIRELVGRDLTAGSATDGGDLVFGRMVDVADAARPQNALDVAGVPRLEVTATGPIAFTRWVKESTLGGWVAEGGVAAATDLTVADVNATPHSAYAKVRISRRLRQQASFDVEQSILRELAAATRATIEDGFINGLGSSNTPLGLLNIAPATSNSWAGATPTHAELITQLQNYTEAHGRLDQARWLANSDLIGRLLASEASAQTGVFRLAMENAQPSILGVPLVLSEAMPDNRLLLINPQTLRMVYWGAPAAMVDRSTYFTSGDSVLTVYNDADIVSLYPAQVCIGKAA